MKSKSATSTPKINKIKIKSNIIIYIIIHILDVTSWFHNVHLRLSHSTFYSLSQSSVNSMLGSRIISYLSDIISFDTIWGSSGKTIDITGCKYDIPTFILFFCYHFLYLIFCILFTWIFHSISLNVHWDFYIFISWFLHWYDFIHVFYTFSDSII